MPARRKARKTRLQGATGHSLAIGPDEQWRGWWPSRQSPLGGGTTPSRVGETDGAAVEIFLDDVHEGPLDWDPTILAALAADIDDCTVVRTPDIADVGAQ